MRIGRTEAGSHGVAMIPRQGGMIEEGVVSALYEEGSRRAARQYSLARHMRLESARSALHRLMTLRARLT
jgi:hypothetical protein